MSAEPPDFMTDDAFIADAEREGYKWTFLNIEEYKEFDRDLFVDTLRDWGFFGPEDKRPDWL